MAISTSKRGNSTAPDVEPLRKQVISAVKVMFDRAVAKDPDNPAIEDSKGELPPSGNLQDCEFGMILLLVREWFRNDSVENEFFANISSPLFERVIAALAKRVVDRVLKHQQQDEGGEPRDANQKAFFVGDPYTRYKKNQKDRAFKFSANLDAAMITVAFLVPAIEQFNDELARIEYDHSGVELPGWVTTLRDAGLFVILDGLRYALDCRVIHNNKFQGFTSDPASNVDRPMDGGLDQDADRLFFSWTTCETINDLKSWRDTYLTSKKFSMQPPEEAVAEAKALIKELDGSLLRAAEWCETVFYPGFQELKVPDTRELVKEVTALGEQKLDDKTVQRVDDMELCVQHVYHLSQYAAIRSLAPDRVSLDEVHTTVDKLDRLVQTSIVNSGLDDSTNEQLFRTLTRRYSLGISNPAGYSDDAWYPLVVRSLSGLLSRTLGEIGKRFARPEVLTLSLTFQRSLETHVNNLIGRRPEFNQNGDEQLWTFAEKQPYVLYATQRTIFALIQYAVFLQTVDEFQNQVPETEDREEELVLVFARRFAEQFRPAIKELLAQAVPTSFGLPAAAPAAIAPAAEAAAPVGPAVSLPDEDWAAGVVTEWLASFSSDFKKNQLVHIVDAQASLLIAMKRYLDGYHPSPGLPVRKAEAAARYITELRDLYKDMRDSGSAGKRLSEVSAWEVDELRPILFDCLFKYYAQRLNTIKDSLQTDPPKLWQLISKATETQVALDQADPAGTSNLL